MRTTNSFFLLPSGHGNKTAAMHLWELRNSRRIFFFFFLILYWWGKEGAAHFLNFRIAGRSRSVLRFFNRTELAANSSFDPLKKNRRERERGIKMALYLN